MSEEMFIMSIFAPLTAIGSAILFIIAFKAFYKYMIQEKKCTAMTTGVVRKYSMFYRGTSGYSIFPPIVYYVVDGKEYHVTGPEVKAVISSSKTSPMGDNSQSFFIKDPVLHVFRNKNSNFFVSGHIMAQLYPIVTNLPVFYCPENPKLAYVKEYCNCKFGFYLCFVSGMLFLLLSLIFTMIVLMSL